MQLPCALLLLLFSVTTPQPEVVRKTLGLASESTHRRTQAIFTLVMHGLFLTWASKCNIEPNDARQPRKRPRVTQCENPLHSGKLQHQEALNQSYGDDLALDLVSQRPARDHVLQRRPSPVQEGRRLTDQSQRLLHGFPPGRVQS